MRPVLGDGQITMTAGDRLDYQRIVLKMSGEALQGDKGYGISTGIARSIAQQIAEVDQMGAEVAVIVGGGNIFRGLEAEEQGMERSSADYMGMLATVMNGLALQDALEKHGSKPRLFSAIEMTGVAEPFNRQQAIHHLEDGGIAIAVAGTGRPYFTTDTAAALRGLELDAEVLLKATRVDGVYDSDPEQDADAQRYDELNFMDLLEEDLRVMDHTATTMCKENDLPILVFDLTTPDNIKNVLCGDSIGTLIHGGETA